MDRTRRERYKYTPAERLLIEGMLPPTGSVTLEVEAAPELFIQRVPTPAELYAWVTPQLEGDPLWEENLATPNEQVHGIRLEIITEGCIADGVIYLHIRYPESAGNDSPTRTVLRNTLILGENTGARVVVYHHHSGNSNLTINAITAIELGAGASLELTEVTETQATLLDTVVVRQYAKSRAQLTCIDLNNRLLRRNQFVALLEKEADCNLSGAYLVDDHQHIDNYVRIEHAVGNCRSNQLFKGVANNHSTAAFTGHIRVAQDAQKTVSLQENHNILLGTDARIDTRPWLEIYADDVRCNHGATIGRLDPEALYYMRQRGIGLEAAQRLQIEGFIGEIIEISQIEELTHLLRSKAVKRLTFTPQSAI